MLIFRLLNSSFDNCARLLVSFYLVYYIIMGEGGVVFVKLLFVRK